MEEAPGTLGVTNRLASLLTEATAPGRGGVCKLAFGALRAPVNRMAAITRVTATVTPQRSADELDMRRSEGIVGSASRPRLRNSASTRASNVSGASAADSRSDCKLFFS